MDIFILDSLLRPIDVVDEFVSMIWAERFSEKGDFQLVTLSTTANKRRFVHDTQIVIPDSKRIMRVDKVEETIDNDRGPVLKITGRELVSILEQRSAYWINPIDDEIKPIWTIYGFAPGNAMRHMFRKICIDGDLNPTDVIPFISEDSLYPPSTIPEPDEGIDWVQKVDNLYNAIKGLGDVYDLGFRLYKDPNASILYFNVYAGSDRSSAQTVLPPVIFSSDMENLMSTTDYSDSTGEFNVILVLYFYKDELDADQSLSVVVKDPAMDPTASGFDRKFKAITVTDIPEDVENTLDYLTEVGKQELAKSRPVSIFDGEVDQWSQYVYERDYFLGDLVEVRGNNGATATMRVDEVIISEDGEGKRTYPSLITKQFSNPGTWSSWKYDVEWSAMGSGEYWDNQ